jgi:DNA transposition AAA+ family ATPase
MGNLNESQLSYINAIHERLEQFCKANPTITNSAIARGTGYSTSYISQFRAKKFPVESTLPEVASSIENFLNNESDSVEQNVGKGTLKFAMTNAARSTFKIANYAMTEGKIGVISGIPGCGKTISVKQYSIKNPTSIMIEVTPLVTQRSLIEDICREIKIPVTFADSGKSAKLLTKNELFNAIISKLKGTKRLLIIDEGENLNVQCLEIVRRIQDFTDIGMLLSGTGKLLDRLRGQRKELQQLYSRIGIQKEIKLLELSDINAILSINFPEALKFASTFLSLSKHNGRYLQHLITLVKRTISETKEALSEDLIDDAASSLLV